MFFRGKCCPFFFGRFLAGKPSSVFESCFLFIFVHFGKLGGQNSGMGSAELLQRFPGGFLRENAAFWSRISYHPTFFPFGYVRVLVIFRLLLAVPLKFGLFCDSASDRSGLNTQE